MDNLHERGGHNGSIGVDSNRRISSRSLPDPLLPSSQIVTVVVHKDENGYGMKVSGDNPVFVQSVRGGGAAEKAGLQSGDTIIKVNGEDVIKSTHTQVVALIRSTTHVKLTVKQHPKNVIRPSPTQIGSPSMPHSTNRPISSHHHASYTQITAPQPVDVEKLRQFENDRVHTIRKMLERAQTDVEALRSELARLPTSADSSKVIGDLTIAERTVGKLQNELQTCLALTLQDSLSASPLLPHTLPKSLTPSPHIPQSKSAHQMYDPSGGGNTPPPLPNRNKPNFNLSSSPSSRFSIRTPPASSDFVENLLYQRSFDDNRNFDTPPPLPPRIIHDPNNPSPPSSGLNESEAVNSINKQMSYPLVATCAALVNNSCNSKRPHIVNTHHRANSSPDQLIVKGGVQQENNHEATSTNLHNSESMTDLTRINRCDSSWELTGSVPGRATPPGTPPPPYPEPITAAVCPLPQKQIISMEDELSDQEQIEDGPFKSLSRLLEHLAHLAVFMNYILTNCDPSSILFYLITDLYKEGNAKDMKKWAYEIHSSFLVPGCPLQLKNVDENVAREIDDVLQKEADKEDILRKVFLKARAKAKEELNELLAEFRQKRNAGLGTFYGPVDSILDESIHEKSVEVKIIEELLQRKLQPYLEDLDHEPVDPRKYTTAVALSTVFTRLFGLRLAHTDLERLPSFVSKDKSLKNKFIGRRTKVNVRGHHFVAHQYYTVTYCNHCQLLIWGIGPQAYRCSNCHSNVHRHCVKIFEENCPGPLVKKEKAGYPISKIMGRIRPETRNASRKPSAHNFLLVEREKRFMEERGGSGGSGEGMENEGFSGDRPHSTTSIIRSGSDRRSDASEDTPEIDTCDKETINENFPRLPRLPKNNSININRSESYKEQSQKKRHQIKERRKISDPNLSKSNDVEAESGILYNVHSGSSSNSSLSSGPSLDSPSVSLEAVAPANNGQVRILGESDPETETLPNEWTCNVPEELISRLSGVERKRQDVFNELLQTERSHVRQLRVLKNVFQSKLENSNLLNVDQLKLLFPNLNEMLELHTSFSQSLKALISKETPLVADVGEALLNMFDGQNGELFENAAEVFCARQQVALEWLRERRRKDAKLHNFLTECEADKMCRRLQLRDLLPMGMQRLTKYPLLFDNLAKYTNQCLIEQQQQLQSQQVHEGEEETVEESPSSVGVVHTLTQQEYDRVLRAVERSKEILNSVNTAVKKAEDYARLQEIQRRLDRSAFDKVDLPSAIEYKNIDITKRRLVHEGPLCWRINNRQKINLHVLLLEDVILLLQKQDDKFTLKYHHTSTPTSSTDKSTTLCPIIKVSTVLVRSNATDNNSIYLITTTQGEAQMYDLVASSPIECKQWQKYITKASEAFTKQDGSRHGRSSTENSEIINEESIHSDQMEAIDENETNTRQEEQEKDTVSMKSTEEEEEERPKQPTEPCNPVPNILAQTLLLSTEQNALIEPSQVTVSIKPVQIAEPVLTPLERLRRTDLVIKSAIVEKQLLVADILNVPRDEFENIAEMVTAESNSGDKEPNELLLAAINQTNQLTELINDTLNINEETAIAITSGGCSWSTSNTTRLHRIPGVPPQRLQTISSTLHQQLTHLLKVIKERDEEREKLRMELHKAREQIHILAEFVQQPTTSSSALTSTSSPEEDKKLEDENDDQNEKEDNTIEVRLP